MKNYYKKLKVLSVAVLLSSFAFAGGGTGWAQIIHNSPDPDLATVDVWVDVGDANGQTLFASGLSFRQATGYLPAIEWGYFTIYLKAPGSSQSDAAIDTVGSTYIYANQYQQFIITGVEGSGYAANPNALNTEIQVSRLNNARIAGTNPPLVDVIAFHGVTDAPGIDVRIRNGGPLLVNNLKYSSYSPGYIQVPPSWYQLEVIVEDSSAVINTWVANVTALAGQAATIFASGFATPASNNGGPAIGLYAVLANGTVIALPLRRTCNVQLVHNAADTSLSTVDVYVNGQLGFPDLAFRGATPFIPITADFPIQIGLAPGNSTSFADTIKTWLYFFDADSNYVAMATGVAGAGYAANPDAISNALDIVLKEGVVIANGSGTNVSVNFANGVSDAYGLDVRIRSGGPLLFNNQAYNTVAGYLQLPAYYYAWEVLKQDSSVLLNAWILNLSTYAGSGMYIFSSGFITPGSNNGGAQFDLFGALPSGQVIAFPRRQTASVQFIHNCADPIADTMDVYINGAKYFAGFEYKNSSPVLGIMTANFPIDIGMAPGGSASVNDTFWHEIRFFSPGQVYIGVAQGNVGSGMAANPDGGSNDFNLFLQNPGQIQAVVNTNFDFYTLHGMPDGPTLDIKQQGGSTLVDNISFGESLAYQAVTTASYLWDIQDSTGTTTFETRVADFSARAGQAGVILSSGYLNPANNNNGAPYGLYLATTAGGPFIPLPLYSSINDLNQEIGLSLFPNPNNGTLFINFNLKQTERVSIDITDINGRVVKNAFSETVTGKQNISVNISDLSNGMYFARITTSEKTSNNKFILVK